MFGKKMLLPCPLFRDFVLPDPDEIVCSANLSDYLDVRKENAAFLSSFS